MTVLNVFPVGPDKKPLIKGWQEAATNCPEQVGRWIGQGVKAFGIPTGAKNNLFVIDLDVDKENGERAGEASLRATRYAHLLDHATVRTPTGGLHIYCRHFDGAKNSTSKIGPKIDTRGEGGYVVGLGSKTHAGTYEGLGNHGRATVPVGLRAMLMQREHIPNTSFCSGSVRACDGEVQELLSHIPADSPYSDWVAVLMALHSRYGGSEAGLAIADQWSAQGGKYKPGEVVTKWRSFKGSGITWATVPALAKKNGADLSAIARRWV